VYFIDYMIATFIFATFILMFFLYAPNIVDRDTSDYDALILEAKTVSNALMSQGIPHNWNTTNVTRIGLMNKNRQLNYTKVAMFFNNISEDETRRKFNIQHNYLVTVINKKGIRVPFGANSSTGVWIEENATKSARIGRIVPYKNKLYEVVVLTWY